MEKTTEKTKIKHTKLNNMAEVVRTLKVLIESSKRTQIQTQYEKAQEYIASL